MFVDANDNVWIGTDSKGFYKYDGSTFVNYNKDSDANIDVTIKTNATVGLCQAANGDIYYAFNKSLVCFSGDYMVVAGTVANEVTITDFTLHFSCCFTKLLHSLFITLLNNFTM